MGVEEGAYVFIAGLRQAEFDKAIAEIGRNVTGVKTDISKLDDLDRLYETVAKKGKIDVIFAGAAFVEKTMTAAATAEHFDKTFNTNARGAYFTVKRPPPHEKSRSLAAESKTTGNGSPRARLIQLSGNIECRQRHRHRLFTANGCRQILFKCRCEKCGDLWPEEEQVL